MRCSRDASGTDEESIEITKRKYISTEQSNNLLMKFDNM